MILQCFSHCSGTQDMKWKSQHATSRVCRSQPSISSSCHRNLTSQVKAWQKKTLCCIIPFQYIHFYSPCLFLVSIEFRLNAPREHFWTFCIKQRVIPATGKCDSIGDNKSKRARCSSEDKARLRMQQALLLLCFLDNWSRCQWRNLCLCLPCNGFLPVWLLNGI